MMQWKAYFIQGCKCIFVFYIYCPVWVKFAIRTLKIILLSWFELRENRRKEVRTFLMVKAEGKAIPLQVWAGPECSRRLRLPDFKTIGT